MMWQTEKVKYINLWRSRRTQETIYAENLVYLNTVSTPQPSRHPWIEWREKCAIEALLLEQRQANRTMALQLLEALRGQLLAQNIANNYLQQLTAVSLHLRQANTNAIALRHQMEINNLRREQTTAIVRAAIDSIQEVLQRLLNHL